MRGKGHPRQGSSLEFACPPPDAAPQKCAQPALAVPRGWVSASPEPRGAERQASQRGVVPRIAAQGAQGDGGEPSVPQAGSSPGRWVPPSGHSPAEPVLPPGRCPRGDPMCRCADPPSPTRCGDSRGSRWLFSPAAETPPAAGKGEDEGQPGSDRNLLPVLLSFTRGAMGRVQDTWRWPSAGIWQLPAELLHAIELL